MGIMDYYDPNNCDDLCQWCTAPLVQREADTEGGVLRYTTCERCDYRIREEFIPEEEYDCDHCQQDRAAH